MLTSLIYNLKDQIMNSPDIEEINAIVKTISDNKELVPVDLDVRIKGMVSLTLNCWEVLVTKLHALWPPSAYYLPIIIAIYNQHCNIEM